MAIKFIQTADDQIVTVEIGNKEILVYYDDLLEATQAFFKEKQTTQNTGLVSVAGQVAGVR